MSYDSPLQDQTLAATFWLQIRYLPSELRFSSARPNTCRDLLVTTPVSTKWATILLCTTKHLPRPLGYDSGIYQVSYDSPLHDQTLAETLWSQHRHTMLPCTTKHLPRPYGHNSGIYYICKTPVTPGGVSTALPRSCLIFQSTVRTQENHDIFRQKVSVTTSLQWPRHCHGALMAFYHVPTVFMVEILCALTVLSLRVHGAHSACAALSRRCHCADAVLKTQWHLKERRAVSVQTPRTTTAYAQRSLCAPTELLFRSRRPYCAAMVTLRRPLCALLGRRANAEWRCLFWVCSKCAPSLGVLCDPTVSDGDATALLRWCLRSYCAHLGVMQFFRTPWGRRPGVTGV